MKQFPTLQSPFFYCTANGTRAHITIVTYPTYLDKKSGKTLCETSGEFIHLGNRLVNDYQARQLGVVVAEICPECLAAYNETWKDYEERNKQKIVPAKGQKRTRKKDITC